MAISEYTQNMARMIQGHFGLYCRYTPSFPIFRTIGRLSLHAAHAETMNALKKMIQPMLNIAQKYHAKGI